MTPSTPLILFIIKQFHDYDGKHTISNGLRSSARFVVDLLVSLGINAKLVEAVDGNSVDALVHENKPARVVLEALWVTPTKLAELKKLWPHVKWTIRIHSETAFLSSEGIAVEWINGYLALGAEVAFNSLEAQEDFSVAGPTVWLPNYYPLGPHTGSTSDGRELNVGCFGAIRPLKNQLVQALGALKFARKTGRALRFHMNGTRQEQSGDSNLKNIQALLGDHLVLHPWLDHDKFLELVKTMSLCLQVSLTESFNVTSADAVGLGVPLIGSNAIKWLPRRSRACVDSADSICEAMHRADKRMAHENYEALERYNRIATAVWQRWQEGRPSANVTISPEDPFLADLSNYHATVQDALAHLKTSSNAEFGGTIVHAVIGKLESAIAGFKELKDRHRNQ